MGSELVMADSDQGTLTGWRQLPQRTVVFTLPVQLATHVQTSSRGGSTSTYPPLTSSFRIHAGTAPFPAGAQVREELRAAKDAALPPTIEPLARDR